MADGYFEPLYARSDGSWVDDFAIGAATEYLGCFCDDHLADFARRAGRFYSKEELFARFKPLTDGALYNRNNVDVRI